jgi:beta-lactamase class A
MLRSLVLLIPALFPLSMGLALAPSGDWTAALREEIASIDAATPGAMGVYVKRLKDGSELRYDAECRWYLASTVKIPIAISYLQLAEQGKVSLDREITLRESDYVDGSGRLLWLEPGTRIRFKEVLESMITRSDSTATDLLIREIGLKRLNRHIQERLMGKGISELTSLLQVRYEAFGELHPRVSELTNMDFMELTRTRDPNEKLRILASKLGVPIESLLAPSLEEAFERYYARGLNSGRLDTFGKVLEDLVEGKLLNRSHTRELLKWMEEMVTGEKRVKAGLPKGLRFAQKTGTQVRRICNVGVIRSAPASESEDPVVLAACLEKFDHPEQTEEALKKLGAALGRAVFRFSE